jgi:hypothetical protein
MPKAYFVVRSVVEEPSREKFDHWYATDHFPEALAGLKPEKGWRFWSAREAGVHYAVYRFADMARLDAALKSDAIGRSPSISTDPGRPSRAPATCSIWCRNRTADASSQ